jgi:hypothetical protein
LAGHEERYKRYKNRPRTKSRRYKVALDWLLSDTVQHLLNPLSMRVAAQSIVPGAHFAFTLGQCGFGAVRMNSSIAITGFLSGLLSHLTQGIY